MKVKIPFLVAEYLALATVLTSQSSPEEYRRANELSWILAMLLPAKIYKHIVLSISSPNEKNNRLTAVIAVREHLGGTDLTADDIAFHAPGAGGKKS